MQGGAWLRSSAARLQRGPGSCQARMLTPRVLATAQVQTIQSTAASLHTAIPSGLTGVPNARDLAEAYPTLRPGMLLRCACPAGATPEVARLLLDTIGVRHMVDLRSGEEAAEDPPGCPLMTRTRLSTYVRRGRWLLENQVCVPEDGSSSMSSMASSSPASSSSPSTSSSSSSAIRHRISLLERSRYYPALAAKIPPSSTLRALFSAATLRPEAARQVLLGHVNAGGLALLYTILLDSAQPEIAAALKVVAGAVGSGSPVLFYCKAGKDRTGMLALLLLAAAGVPREAIVDDYHRSDAYHAVALAGLEKRSELAGLDRAAFERAPREAVQAALRHLDQVYGGPRAYMARIGFSYEQQDVLRAALVVDGQGSSSAEAAAAIPAGDN